MGLRPFGISCVLIVVGAILSWLSRQDIASASEAPKLRAIHEITEELKKDGDFSEEDAKTIAMEVARRIWFPEPEQLTISSKREEAGGWTVSCIQAAIKPATNGCSIKISKSGYVEEAVFLTASDRQESRTKQCSGLAIKSVLMESPRSRAADRHR